VEMGLFYPLLIKLLGVKIKLIAGEIWTYV